MKGLMKRHYVGGALIVLAFIPLWLFMPRDYLFDLVNGLAVSVGFGVVIAYASGIRRSFREMHWSGAHALVLGVSLSWISLTARHTWNWVWRFLDKPPELVDNPLVAFMAWLAMSGGIMLLAATGAIEGGIPRKNWIRAGVYIALGLALASLVIVFLDPGQSL